MPAGDVQKGEELAERVVHLDSCVESISGD
jgi:hypothetical protein